jgi:hypothetical protein
MGIGCRWTSIVGASVVGSFGKVLLKLVYCSLLLEFGYVACWEAGVGCFGKVGR